MPAMTTSQLAEECRGCAAERGVAAMTALTQALLERWRDELERSDDPQQVLRLQGAVRAAREILDEVRPREARVQCTGGYA